MAEKFNSENNENDILFDKWLEKELSEDEQKEFDLRIESDPAFKKMVNTAAHSIGAIKTNAKMQDISREIQKEIDSDKYEGNSNLRVILLVAAVAAIILLGYFFLNPFGKDHQSSPEELFAEYYETPSSRAIVTLSGGDEDRSRQDEILKDYNIGAYGLVIEKIEDQVLDNSTKSKLSFINAASEFEVGNYSKAARLYDKIIQEDHHEQHRAKWYLALIHLKQGDIELAKKYLQLVIENEKEFNIDNAKRLLSILSSHYPE